MTEAEKKELAALQQRLNQHVEAGEFEAAAKVAQQIAKYRARRQGAGHHEAIDARFEVEEWQRRSQVPAKDRAEVLRAIKLNSEGVGLLNRRRSLAFCTMTLVAAILQRTREST